MAKQTDVDLARLHAVIAGACSAWETGTPHGSVRAYLERHGVWHMLAAGQLEAARSRLSDVAFMAAFAEAWDSVVIPWAAWRILGADELERSLRATTRASDADLASVADFLEAAGRPEAALWFARRAKGTSREARLRARLRVAALQCALERTGARARLEAVLAQAVATLGEDDEVTGLALTHATQAALRDGDPDAAEEWARRDVASSTRRHGADHPETLTAESHLAAVLRHLGRLDEAESHATRVLEARERLLGPGHPSTLAAMGNLAVVLRNQGQGERARVLLAEVARRTRRMLGPAHPHTLGAFANLCVTLRDLGEAEEAHAACLEALLAAGPSVQGESVRTLRMHGAMALSDLGRHAEAAAWLEEVLASSLAALGEDHPDTLIVRYKLASVCAQDGDTDRAEAHLRTVVDLRRARLGEAHRQTRLARESLAELLESDGRPHESRPLRRREVEMDVREGAPATVATIARRYALGTCLRDAGYLAEAHEMLSGVLETERRLLGPGAAALASTHWALAECLVALERPNEAAAHRRACLRVERRAEGSVTEDVLVTVTTLIGDLLAAGRRSTALRLRRRYLREARATLAEGDVEPSFLACVDALTASVRRGSEGT